MQDHKCVTVFLFIISLIVGHFNSLNSVEADASQLLFATIRAARFCNLCRVFFLDSLQLPYIEKQNWERG